MSLRELLDEPSRLEMKANSLEREIQTKAIEQNEVFEKAQKCFSDVLEKVLLSGFADELDQLAPAHRIDGLRIHPDGEILLQLLLEGGGGYLHQIQPKQEGAQVSHSGLFLQSG